MAPINEQALKPEAVNSFFKNVNTTSGYPAVEQKDQPWKKYVANTPLGQRFSGKGDHMVVVCSVKHDYGTQGLGGY